MTARALGPGWFREHDVVSLARALLGKVLLKDGVGGPIVEVEAYHQDEPASHAHRGLTPRCASLFLDGGHAYVYRIHQSLCFNVVAPPAGTGCGVLIRAVTPTDGRDAIAARRRGHPERSWSDGPGKVCRALGITLDDDGAPLSRSSAIRLVDRGVFVPDAAVEVGPRVGISKATELPWRFRVAPEALV